VGDGRERLGAWRRKKRGRTHLEDSLLDAQQRHIERSAAQVEDEHVLLAGALRLLVQAVRDRGGGGLVDDPQHVEASNDARVLGRLALAVVEVGGHGDDGGLDGVAQIRFRDFAHLDQHHAADLFRRELLGLAFVGHDDVGLAVRRGDDLRETVSGQEPDWAHAARTRLLACLKRPVLHVILNAGIGELAADEALGIEDRVLGVERNLRARMSFQGLHEALLRAHTHSPGSLPRRR